MKSHLFAVLLLGAGLLCGDSALGEVFRWIDENGKTHFGDRVPEKYRSEAQDLTGVVADDANTMKSVDYEKAREERERRKRYEEDAQRLRSRQPLLSDSSEKKKTVTQTGNEGSCEEQWARFDAAKACYEGCQVTYNHGRWENYAHNTNTAACGHCTDVKKPGCSR